MSILKHNIPGVPHFARLSGLAILDDRLSAQQVRILAIIALFTNTEGLGSIDARRIATYLRMSDNPATYQPAISKAVAVLIKAGYLEIVRKAAEGRAALYRLKVATDAESHIHKAEKRTEKKAGKKYYDEIVDEMEEAPEDRMYIYEDTGLMVSYREAKEDLESEADMRMHSTDVYRFFELV